MVTRVVDDLRTDGLVVLESCEISPVCRSKTMLRRLCLDVDKVLGVL